MREQFTNSKLLPGEILEESHNGSHDAGAVLVRVQTVNRLRMLWGQRVFLARLAAAGLIAGLLAAFLIPKRFQSTTRLMPPDQSNSSMAMLSAALGGKAFGSAGGGSTISNIAGDLLGVKNSTDLFIGILQSRTIEDDLINKFELRKVYRDRYMKDAREDLEDKTSITADRKSGILRIQVTDKDPKRAAAMAGEYVEELNRLVAQVNTTSAHRERVFLEERLTGVNKDLENAEKSFSQFASKNTALDIPMQGKAMIEASAALKGQLIVAQTELQGLRQIYTDNNVRVRGLEARVAELQKQIQQIGGKFDDSTDPNIQEAQSMYPSIRKLPVLGVNYADLYRDMKVQEAVFETLTQEYELAKVQEAKETPSVKVIDPPDVPEKLSFPPRPLIIVASPLLLCLFGVLWIFGNERWQQIDPEDPGKVLVMEVTSHLKAHLPSGPPNGNGITQAHQAEKNK